MCVRLLQFLTLFARSSVAPPLLSPTYTHTLTGRVTKHYSTDTYTYMYTYVCIHIYTYTHAHILSFVCVCLCVCVYVCLYNTHTGYPWVVLDG